MLPEFGFQWKRGEDVPMAATENRSGECCRLARDVLGVQPCLGDWFEVSVAAIWAHNRRFHSDRMYVATTRTGCNSGHRTTF